MTRALPGNGKFSLPLAADSVALVTARPTLAGTPRAVIPAAITQTSLRIEKPVPTGGRVLLALKAAAAGSTIRVRVYGGAGNLVQADLLGQATLSGKPDNVLVDVTRYTATAPGKPLVFQIVPEDALSGKDSFTISAAELRIFGPR